MAVTRLLATVVDELSCLTLRKSSIKKYVINTKEINPMQLFVRQYSGVSVTGRPLSQQDAIMVASDITMNQELNAELTTEVQVWQQSALVKQFSCNSAILLAVADGVSASPAASIASRLVVKHLAFCGKE